MTTILNRLIELEAKAPPAPWGWAQLGNIDYGYVDSTGKPTILFGESSEGAVESDDPQGVFLSALRNAAPALLALAKAASEMCDRRPHGWRYALDLILRHDAALAQLTKEIE